jgi:hypothetical protein
VLPFLNTPRTTALYNKTQDKKKVIMKRTTMTVSSTTSSRGGGGGGGESAAIAAAVKSLQHQHGKNNGASATATATSAASIQQGLMQRTMSRRRSSNAAGGGGSHAGGGGGITFSEDGSLSSDGMPLDLTDSERDEEEEVAKLAKWETHNVRCWRTGVFLLLLILGATISTVAFVFFQQAEQQDFKVDVRII